MATTHAGRKVCESCGRAENLPHPQTQPLLQVEEAGRLIGVGRSKAYDLVNQYLRTEGEEGLPVIRFNRTLRVPTAQLWRLLGLDP